MIKELVGLASAAALASTFGITQIAQILSPPMPEAQIKGKVVKVVDGDTLDVQQGYYKYRVRLACVDAPEKGHKPYGELARLKLMEYVASDVVVDVNEKADRYGRRVGEVYAKGEDGKTFNVNLRMAREGYAFVYHQYLNACQRNREEYLDADVTAKDKKEGFHAIENFPLPWDWRADKKSSSD